MSYLDSTLKTLGILSGNKCAFPDCSLPLIEENGILTGEICHIKARNSGGKRYDASQTNKERNAFENLILLCPFHHTVIDSSEEIFTVEVLQKLKKEHESKNKNSESSQQEKLAILIDKLHSIIEKEDVQFSDSTKLLKEKNSSLVKAKNLAAQKLHDERCGKWQNSHDGLMDTINSINEIYSFIEQRINKEVEIFETLGVKLNSKDMYLKSIYNKDFISQLEVKGIQENSYHNVPADISLEIILFRKRPTYQPQSNAVYTDVVKQYCFKPYLLPDGQICWSENERISNKLSAEGICEKMFDLLINEIGNKKPKGDSWKDNFIKDNEDDWY